MEVASGLRVELRKHKLRYVATLMAVAAVLLLPQHQQRLRRRPGAACQRARAAGRACPADAAGSSRAPVTARERRPPKSSTDGQQPAAREWRRVGGRRWQRQQRAAGGSVAATNARTRTHDAEEVRGDVVPEQRGEAEEHPREVGRIKSEQPEQRDLHARVALAPQVDEHKCERAAEEHDVAPGRHGHQRRHAKEQAPEKVRRPVPERAFFQRPAVPDAARGAVRTRRVRARARSARAARERAPQRARTARTQSTCGRESRCRCCQSRRSW